MVLYDGLDTVLLSANTPRLDIVFVHSLGLGPESTWHDETSGKSWIEETDYIFALGWRARVMSFRYHSDIASNMSAASIAIHANDLLYHLEKSLEKSDDIGLIFVAHGLGGAIVKKALRVRDLAPNCPRVRDATTGVVFIGTPHADTDSEALLQATRNSVQLLRHDHHSIEEEDIRHFAAALGSINTIFNTTRPRALQIISFWEEKPSTWKATSGEECSDLVIPKSCQKANLWNNIDLTMDCKHLEMPHFPSLFDPRFTAFCESFSALVNRVLEHKTIVTKPLKSTTGPPGQKPRRQRPSRRSSFSSSSSGSDTEDGFVSWQRRREYEENATRSQNFLQSLKGWSHANTGHDVFVAKGTCDWIPTSQAFRTWFDHVTYGTFFWLADPGSGKTHLAKAVAAYFENTRRKDVVLSFFCEKGEPTPHIWEYFTWALLQARPAWFGDMPAKFQHRNGSSQPLGAGDFVDIWTGLRQSDDNTKESIWLVVDGLEQCGDEAFLRFWKSLEQLRRRQTAPNTYFAYVKILFTGTLTSAMIAVAGDASRYYVAPQFTEQDIAAYIDTRLDRCIESSSLDSVKTNLEALKTQIKEASANYWPFARDAIVEVEQSLGSNLAKVSSFQHRLPTKLEELVQHTILSVRQSVGPLRYLRPALALILGNKLGPKFNLHQLNDALVALYGREEIRNADLADLLLNHCGGMITLGAAGTFEIRHSFFERELNIDVPDSRRYADLAYMCMTYLLHDDFEVMPPPQQIEQPTAWLDEHCPFYSHAAQYCLEYLANVESEDDRLAPLFLRLYLGRPPQWYNLQKWRASVLNLPDPFDHFEELPIAPVLANEKLLPLLARLCPPPVDTSKLPLVKRIQCHWKTWREVPDPAMPRYSMPEGWLTMRSDQDRTPLLAAAQNCQVAAIRYILSWRPSVAVVNERGGNNIRPILMMLYSATWQGDAETKSTAIKSITSELIQHGVNPNLGDEEGFTPLHVACDQDDLALVRLLLDNGASPNIANLRGCTAWQVACERGVAGILSEFIARGVEVDSLFDNGKTALTYLIRKAKLDSLRVVLPVANINLIDGCGNAPIHAAARQGEHRLELLRLLISQDGIDLDLVRDHKDADRVTALLLAIVENDHLSVETLLRAGASAGYIPGLRVLPLEVAVRKGYRDIAELLLRHRAPVNEFLIDSHKRTALATAAMTNDLEMMNLLLDYGADPTIEDGLQKPNAALFLLQSEFRQIEGLKRLLRCPNPPAVIRHYSSVDPEENDHSMMFIYACNNADADFAEALLDNGVDLTAWLELDKQISPLHAAVFRGSVATCRLLLDKEPRLLDLVCLSRGNIHSPLHDACFNGRSDAVKLLIEKGADIKLLTPHRGRSCLLLASMSKDLDTVKAILAAENSAATLASFLGETPLQEASLAGDLKMAEELLKAGASSTQITVNDKSCISPEFFHTLKERAIPMLKLFLKYGLDLNASCTAQGQTPFALAMGDASPSVVRWLLKQGADPARTLHTLTKSHTVQYGPRWASIKSPAETIDLILPLYRERLTEQDWTGQDAMGTYGLNNRQPYTSRLYWLCEETRTEGSEDLFATMMLKPNFFGFSPLDHAMGDSSCVAEARPGVAQVAIDFLDSLVENGSANGIVDYITLLLKTLGYRDAEGFGPLLTLQSSRAGIKMNSESPGYVRASSSGNMVCSWCAQSPFEKVFWCSTCYLAACVPCKEGSRISLCGGSDEHTWVDVTLDETSTAESPEVQEAVRKVRAYLLSVVEENAPDRLSESSTAVGEREEAEQKDADMQSALQLATLHAFGMLAVRRPIWTMHLPLCSRALEIIAPFEGNIASMRKAHDRRMLDGELTLERRKEEMLYMTSRMGRMSYPDEGLFRRDMVLGEMAGLFGEND